MKTNLIAGVDEAGRGPLAGPVIAAAVILDPCNPIFGLADSKQLSSQERERLEKLIQSNAISWSIGRADVDEIDQLNILQATMLAMQRAVNALDCEPGKVLIDGNRTPELKYPSEAVVKGDQKYPVISAASILAKVARDRELVQLDKRFPGYGLAQHKGYPTKAHIACIAQFGVTPIHRKSFKPVKQLLRQ